MNNGWRIYIEGLPTFIVGLILASALLAGAPASADSSYVISGPVHVTKVTDGDSLRSGNLRIRIYGIDAPELKQQCRDQKGAGWSCGNAAREKLKSLIGLDADVFCHLRDVDRYGRLIMQCFHGTVDIGAAMVRSGYALAYRTFSEIYSADEEFAKTAGDGMWQGAFLPPWEWRQHN